MRSFALTGVLVLCALYLRAEGQKVYCGSSYFANHQQCFSNYSIPHCVNYTEPVICNKCEFGYMVNPMVTEKVQCIPNYYTPAYHEFVQLESAAPTNCFADLSLTTYNNSYSCVINNTLICQSCQKGYIYVDQLCKQCTLAYCKTCNPANLTQCYQCLDGFYYSDTDTCQQCNVPSCQLCSTAFNCLQCDAYYRIDATQKPYTCQRCTDVNCRQCKQAINICERCDDGYYLLSANSSFDIICESCQTVVGVFHCLNNPIQKNFIQSCLPGYYLLNKVCIRFMGSGPCLVINELGRCLECFSTTGQFQQPQYILSNGSCVLVSSLDSQNYACAQAQVGTNVTLAECKACRRGFALQNQKCTPCDQSYSCTCTQPNVCSGCVAPFSYITQSNTFCAYCGPNIRSCDPMTGQVIDCSPGYNYSQELKKCYNCKEIDPNCQECYHNGDYNKSCVKCIENYFQSNFTGKCMVCDVKNCKICSSTTECQECQKGFTRITPFVCATIDNCALHNPLLYQCRVCRQGFVYDKAKKLCNSCTQNGQKCPTTGCTVIRDISQSNTTYIYGQKLSCTLLAALLLVFLMVADL